MPAIKQDSKGVKVPYNLSPRIQWLRDYYYKGSERKWNNAFLPFSTGAAWDELYDEQTFYIVPETFTFFNCFCRTYNQNAYEIKPPEGFFDWPLPERKAWFTKEAMVNYVP